jgi:hypothetical protein
MFYQKAISAWRDASETSRVELVKQYFKAVPGFSSPQVIFHPPRIPTFLQMLGSTGRRPVLCCRRATLGHRCSMRRNPVPALVHAQNLGHPEGEIGLLYRRSSIPVHALCHLSASLAPLRPISPVVDVAELMALRLRPGGWLNQGAGYGCVLRPLEGLRRSISARIASIVSTRLASKRL